MFFLIISFLLLSNPIEVQEDIILIDRRVAELEAEKSCYLKKAKLHRERGQQQQFTDLLESRREYLLAEQDRDRILLINLKIKNLLEKKEELLEEEIKD